MELKYGKNVLEKSIVFTTTRTTKVINMLREFDQDSGTVLILTKIKKIKKFKYNLLS